jgi:hypothetical protein
VGNLVVNGDMLVTVTVAENTTSTKDTAMVLFTVGTKLDSVIVNRIFLSTAGRYVDDTLSNVGVEGEYWSSSLCSDSPIFIKKIYSVLGTTTAFFS